MQKLTLPNHTIEELEALLNSNPDYIIGMRLMALIQIKKGMSSRQLEKLYYKSHSRYCVWVNNFKKEGIDGLRNKPKSGRASRLTNKEKEEIRAVMLDTRPEDFGYNSATWNGPLMIDYIKERYNKVYKKAQIYNIIKSFGLTFQKGRAKYYEADEEKREEFKTKVKKTARRT